MKKTLALVFVAILMPIASQAQTSPAPSDSAVPISCFDYYKFGSVQVDITSETQTAIAGTTYPFTAHIVNQNAYPIVDGRAVVKIFRKQSDTSKTQINSDFVVDQFIIADHITLDAQASTTIPFTWKVPSASLSGDYKIASFFVASGKFNLLGLTFTDDILGNSKDFKVKGEYEGIIEFDKNGVKVDGEQYRFAAFTPKLDARKPITVSAPILNTTDRERNVEVVWQTYSWDAMSEENLLKTESKVHTVGPNSTEEVSTMVSDTTYPVYLIMATLKFEDSKSILGIRFTRDGLARARLNFPSIVKFPIKKGESNTIFSCLHSAGTVDTIPGGSLDLTLADKSGNEISKLNWVGAVTGAMMGLKQDFVPRKNYDNVTLKAKLLIDGTLVDSSETVYECSEINPETCVRNGWWMYVLFLFMAIVLVIMFILRRRKASAISDVK